MEIEGVNFNHPNVRAALASRTGTANIARLLRRWTGSRRPAVLFVLVGETPFADVYAEEDLRNIFPVAPVMENRPPGREPRATLRVYVADHRGTMVYIIADPRASHGQHSKADREPGASDRMEPEPRILRV